MNKVISFDFRSHPVRVLNERDEPWFVALDVCRALEIANSRDALASLDPDEKGVGNGDTLGGKQKLQVVNESGLYHLIFKSRKPAAKRFRRWVTSEVLPSIHRTGKYAATEPVDAAKRATIPAYLGRRGALTFEELMYFGAKVRHFAQAMGISYEFELDPMLGRVRSYSLPVLEMAWNQLERKRRLALGGGGQLDLFVEEVAA